jgi:hypothetical protein
MSAPKLAFFLGITLVALLTLTKGAKTSKHCDCDNRASDFPADDAGSVLRRSVTTLR